MDILDKAKKGESLTDEEIENYFKDKVLFDLTTFIQEYPMYKSQICRVIPSLETLLNTLEDLTKSLEKAEELDSLANLERLNKLKSMSV